MVICFCFSQTLIHPFALNVHDDGYSRKASCALHLVSTFLSYWHITTLEYLLLMASAFFSINIIANLQQKQNSQMSMCFIIKYSLKAVFIYFLLYHGKLWNGNGENRIPWERIIWSSYISTIFSRFKRQIGESLPILISRVSHINFNSAILQIYYGENE